MSLFSFPYFKAIDGNGHPIRGGKLYAYIAGTSTAQDTFSDYACTIPNTVPVILNSEGEATVYLQGSYKFNLLTSADGQVPGWPVDNISGVTSPLAALGNVFYPASTATDHGVTGSSNTVKYYCDTIGTTDKATLYFKHDSGTEWTDYDFATTDTYASNTNISFVFEMGARIVPAAGKTVTLPSVSNVNALPSQQIFSGLGSSVFSTNEVVSPGWFGYSITAIDIYVDGATGSDTVNHGYSSAKAFATVQKGLNVASAMVIKNATLTVNIADGTYAENLSLYGHLSTGNTSTTMPTVVGNIADNAAVHISPAGGNALTVVNQPNPWLFKSIKFSAPVAGNAVVADIGTVLHLSNCNFGTTASQHLLSEWGSFINLGNDDYTISGSATTHAYAVRGSSVYLQAGNTVTITGAPAFTYFAYAGHFSWVDYTSTTFAGAATGGKAHMIYGGKILIPNQLPGDLDSSTGDYSQVETLAAGALALTSGVGKTVASITIGPGEFDIWGDIHFTGNAATTVNYITASISDVDNSSSVISDESDYRIGFGATVFGTYSTIMSAKVGPLRLAMTAADTFYLVALAGFGVNTCSAYGNIRARRINEY